MIVCCLTSRGPLKSTINDYELINKYIVNAKLILLFPAAVSSSSKFETLLQYEFNHKNLLDAVVTRPSKASHQNYERLEYLGDAVLGNVKVHSH
jgi:hypothetical protein